jgi:hypothetical protein
MEPTDGNQPDYQVTADGRISFSAAGRAFYTAYFGYAGIDIRRISMHEEFLQAGRQAFPYLFAFMGERLKQRPQTLETRAIQAILADDAVSLERIDRQLATRERLTVLPGSNDGR